MKLSIVFATTVVCIVPYNCNAGIIEPDEQEEYPIQQHGRKTEWSNPIKGSEKADAIGTIYGSLALSVSRNPSLKTELFQIALFGHAAALAGDDVDEFSDKVESLVEEYEEVLGVDIFGLP